MKKIFLLLASASLAAACSQDALETFPSTKVPADVVYGDTDNAQSAMTGVIGGLGSSGWGSGHINFGLACTYLDGDLLGEDYVQSGTGSGWRWQTYSYVFKRWYNDTQLQPYSEWNMAYTTINSCNNLIGVADLLSETPRGQAILGQAYALRALSYYNLANLYARAYYYFPDDPCVPIYTEPTTAQTQGQPRSTNREVFENVIIPDIEQAVTVLKEALDGGAKRSSKTEIDYYVAQGLRARIALTTHAWDTAIEAANAALAGSFDGVSFSAPLSGAQLTGGMNDVPALPSVMWGEIKTADNYSMYASFLSHMDANHDGYAKSARPCILEGLYEYMGAGDTRRQWWLGDFDDANYQSSGEAIKYCQKKFKFKGDTWFGDYIYMRSEEMLLTLAEAYCQKGDDGQARNFLNRLMSARDASYSCADKSGNTLNTLTTFSDGGATKAVSLLDEILIQRRIELWGELGRIYDIKRLHQGFQRFSTNPHNPDFNPASGLPTHDTQDPDTYAWIFPIPQSEFDGNSALDFDRDQNPMDDHK